MLEDPNSDLGRLARAQLILPYYHVVSDDDVVHVKHLYGYKTIAQFERDLEFLLANYCPIGLDEVIEGVATGRRPRRPSFHLTFDDGFREMHDIVAPALLAKGVSATFFVNSAFIDNRELCYLNKASILIEAVRRTGRMNGVLVALRSEGIAVQDGESGILSITYANKGVLDRIAAGIDVDFRDYLARHTPYLTTPQIDQLIQRGFTIGAHSVDHPLYSTISLEDQVGQTLISVAEVRKKFRLPYGVFAFPHSDFKVSSAFFTRIGESRIVDLTFGTAGLMEDSAPNHLQRFSLEKPVQPADRIVAFHHARRLAKMMTWRSKIIRN